MKTQERQRIEAGMQCPECYGANTGLRYELQTKETDSTKFECRSCGCNWSTPIKVTR